MKVKKYQGCSEGKTQERGTAQFQYIVFCHDIFNMTILIVNLMDKYEKILVPF